MRRKLNQINLRSESGAVLITAMILMVLASLALVGAEGAKTFFQRQSRATEIRAKMTAQESVIRLVALQPQTYRCPVQAAGAISSFADCTLVKEAFDRIERMPVNGATCPPGLNNCGIRLLKNDEAPYSGLTLSPQGVFTGTLVYEGNETKIPPTLIRIEIPSEVIQAELFDCALRNPETPVFIGFDANGRAECVGFRNAPCPAGSFVSAVDFPNRSVTCTPLNSVPGHARTCGSQEYVAEVHWEAVPGNQTQARIECAPLPEAPYDWAPPGAPPVTTGTAPATPTPVPQIATPTPTPAPTPVPETSTPTPAAGGRWVYFSMDNGGLPLAALGVANFRGACYAAYPANELWSSVDGAHNGVNAMRPIAGPCPNLGEGCSFQAGTVGTGVGFTPRPMLAVCNPAP